MNKIQRLAKLLQFYTKTKSLLFGYEDIVKIILDEAERIEQEQMGDDLEKAELEDLKDNHDCHLSAEDSCPVCEMTYSYSVDLFSNEK